jgi:hypothetical protein
LLALVRQARGLRPLSPIFFAIRRFLHNPAQQPMKNTD